MERILQVMMGWMMVMLAALPINAQNVNEASLNAQEEEDNKEEIVVDSTMIDSLAVDTLKCLGQSRCRWAWTNC